MKRLKSYLETTREVAQLQQEVLRLRRELENKEHLINELQAIQDAEHLVKPENIVWIFGSGRSGSTWLSSMMGALDRQTVWDEPWVGTLFGNFYYQAGERRHQGPHFILGLHKESWLQSIRNFVLERAMATFPNLTDGDYLIIKEPNGSIGAPLMVEALPKSRMVLLVRDPRDVVASNLDGRREGGWNFERTKNSTRRQGKEPPRKDSVYWAERLSQAYVRQLGKAKQAYDTHEGAKVLVRYEELRVDTVGTLKRIYSTLGITVDEQQIERVVDEHAWENIPEEQKGEGKFYRKATPGSWRNDLTPEQVCKVEEVTHALLNELTLSAVNA
jgi:hypothetical protein